VRRGLGIQHVLLVTQNYPGILDFRCLFDPGLADYSRSRLRRTIPTTILCSRRLAIADWSSFLSVQAEAAATLTGLVFVAMSINAERVMVSPGLPARVGEAVLQFLQVFFVASVMLAPDLPGRTRPVEVLVIAIVSWGAQVSGQLRYLKVRAGHPWTWFMWRAVLAQLATIPFCIAGVLLLAGNPYALDWLMPGFLFSFVGGLLSAWVLLVEIRR